ESATLFFEHEAVANRLTGGAGQDFQQARSLGESRHARKQNGEREKHRPPYGRSRRKPFGNLIESQHKRASSQVASFAGKRLFPPPIRAPPAFLPGPFLLRCAGD